MRLQVTNSYDDTSSVFALARRILSGAHKAEAQVPDVDIQSGIGRALRQASCVTAAQSLRHKAAHAIGVVEGTLIATDAIDGCLCEAQELISQALATQDTGARALIAGRFTDLVNRIDELANAATFSEINLISGGKDKIELICPIGAQPRHAIGHIVLMAGERGLGLKLPRNNFRDNQSIEQAALQLTRARARLFKAADTFLNQASMLAPYLADAAEAA